MPKMGLLSGNNKNNIAQHFLLLNRKPENGQRIDLTAFQWPSLPNGDNQHNNDNSDRTNLNQDILNDQKSHVTMNQSQNTEQVMQSEDIVVHKVVESDAINHLTEENICQSLPNNKFAKPMDMNCHHVSLHHQTERLLRRIRRIQFKQTQRHIHKQMNAFVEQTQNTTGIKCQRQNVRTDHDVSVSSSSATTFSQSFRVSSTIEDRMKLLTPEGVKGLSTSALVNLVKRLESSGGILNDNIIRVASHTPLMPAFRIEQQQQQQTPPPIASPMASTSLHSDSVQLHHHQSNTITPYHKSSTLVKLLERSPETASQETLNSEEIETSATIGTLMANLKHYESGYDSDATMSSSGGESCDEFEEYQSDITQQYSGHFIPLQKRSSWKWASERGAIASRWTWLMAQVADLEFKIRQQNEMYRQLRATKGVISFCGGNAQTTNVPSVSSSTTINNVTLNGVNVNSIDSDSNSVRTMPLNEIRKRKLVMAVNALSGATRKAAKYSTVQCTCNGFPNIVSPCVLCNGRYSYVQVIDTDCMPHFERVALLDSSCHPVLSLYNDVSLGLHFSELLKRETIQKPVALRQQNKRRKTPPSPTFGTKFNFDTKSKSPKRSQSVISSTKLRKKYDGTTKRKYVRRTSSGDGTWRRRGRPRERSSSGGSSRTDSPIPSPAPSENSICGISAPLHRRRRSEQHAYDINNIVIPYSIAATTRVEKLQYKEILTPKWRINDLYNGESSKPVEELNTKELNTTELNTTELKMASGDGIIEETDDKSYEERHAICEVEERKRILAFIKGASQHGSLRGRTRVRFDNSKSENVANNTNNGQYGDGQFQNIDTNSQDSLSSPNTPLIPDTPSTPVSVTPVSVTPVAITPVSVNPAPLTNERRRTLSNSHKRDDSIEEETVLEVPPFDRRTFPIPDSEYEALLQTPQLNQCEDLELKESGDPEKSNDGTITANTSRAPSPTHSDPEHDAESTVDNIEDIDNDPEWEPQN